MIFYDFIFSIVAVDHTGENIAIGGYFNYFKQPWKLEIDLPRDIKEAEWNNIKKNSQNTNNKFEPMSGVIKIYRDVQDEPLLVKIIRYYFSSASYHLLTHEDYQKYFHFNMHLSYLKKLKSV